MLANRRDDEATDAAYLMGIFQDAKRRSFQSIAGHKYLFGVDVSRVRREIYDRDGGKCARCGKDVPYDGFLTERAHMMHKQGGRGPQRCDCPHNLELGCFECHMGRNGEHKGAQFSKQWYASGREETKR